MSSTFPQIGPPRARLRFSLTPEPARLLRSRERMRDYLSAHCADEGTVNDVVLAVQEACTNAIRHSGSSAPIEISLGFEGYDLQATIKDRGHGFAIDRFDATAVPDPRRVGGRGLYIMSRLCDEIELRRDGGLEISLLKRAVAQATLPLADVEPTLVPTLHRTPAQLHRMRALLDEIDEGFAMLDWEFRYTHVNPAACRLLELTEAEILGRTPCDLWSEYASPEVESAYRAAMELGRPSITEYETADHRWFEERIYPTTMGVSVYFRNIDARKRIESEAAHLIAHAPAAVYEIDFRGPRFVRVNDFMCAYSGYSREELLATNPLDLLDEDSQRRFRERIGRALAGEQLEQSVEYRFVGKHGEERRVALSLTPTFDGGKPVRAFVVAYDITERSRLLEQANTTNQRLNDLLSSMADGFVSVDRTWRYTLVNPRAEELIGRPAQELLGHSMEVLFPEMEGWPHYRRVMADRVPETFEVWSRPLETWLEVHASPAGDGISILFADITERRCTEEALRTSEGRLATVLENSRDGINMLDLASGRYVFMNEAQVALTGFTMEEINGISAEEAHQRVHPDDRRLSIEQQSRVAAGEDVDEPVEYRWRVKSGAYRWFSDRRKLVRDEHGKPVALVGISRDITGRKTAEEALRRSEEQNRLERRRLEDVIEAMPSAVVLVEAADGRFSYVNRRANELYGLDYVGFDLQAHLARVGARRLDGAPLPLEEMPVAHALRGEERRDVEMIIERADGLPIPVVVSAAPLRDADGNVTTAIVVFDDITERKLAEVTLSESARLSKALNAIDVLMHSSLDARQIIEAALREGAQAIGADTAGLGLHDDERAEFTFAYLYGFPEERRGAIATDEQDLLGVTAMRSRHTLAIDDVRADRRTSVELMNAWGARAVICAPLIIHGEPIAVVYFNYSGATHRFGQSEIEFVTKLAGSFSAALENARLHEALTSTAATLQQNFIHPLPEVSGWEFGEATESASATALVGGDFHDVFEVAPGNIALLIGDVEGKGIAAAGTTETVRAATRALALSAPSPHYVLDRLNVLLLHEGSQLVTAAFADVSRVSGMFVIASAGHPAPLQLRRDGSVEPLSLTPAPPLGAFEQSDFMVTTQQLEVGDTLVLYTDGVIDARRDGRFFGEQGAIATVAGCAGQSAQEIAERLRDTVVAYADELRDDVHVLVVRRRPADR